MLKCETANALFGHEGSVHGLPKGNGFGETCKQLISDLFSKAAFLQRLHIYCLPFFKDDRMPFFKDFPGLFPNCVSCFRPFLKDLFGIH